MSAAGVVYLGFDIISKQDVAIKLERINTEHPQLENEIQVYKRLAHWWCWCACYSLVWNGMRLQRHGP
jgi:serine/threonine protein kinase